MVTLRRKSILCHQGVQRKCVVGLCIFGWSYGCSPLASKNMWGCKQSDALQSPRLTTKADIQKILFGRDSYEFIFLRPFPLYSCESNKWSWIKWFSHVSHLTFHRAQVSSQFGSNFLEIQPKLNLGLWILAKDSAGCSKLPQPGARTAFPIWRTQGASFTACLCWFTSPTPGWRLLSWVPGLPPLMLITTSQGENKNSRAILMMKSSVASSSDVASLVLGSLHCRSPWTALLHVAPRVILISP